MARWIGGVMAVLVAGTVWSAMIVPPADLGELVATSECVVVARARASRGGPGPYVPHTVTRFARVELVTGTDPGPEFLVSVPGGRDGGIETVVPGAPSFRPGGEYLLFLARGADGLWRVRTLAYGVLERVEIEGELYFRPVVEREAIGFVRRFDVEVPGVYRAAALVRELREVAAGRTVWDGRVALAPETVRERFAEKDAPSSCRFMTASDGHGVRWFAFDDGGSATIRATTPGQTGIGDGGTGAVSAGAAAWTDDGGSAIELVYGGTTARSISCSGTGTHYQGDAVVFDDPCGDIDPLSNCTGTLAYGGPSFYTSTRTFDGQQWHEAVSLFVVVNDGSECAGETNFAEFITHELGHGLGFGHHTDSDATMYAYCCHYPRGAGLGATDRACAAYLYPDASAPTPPAAPSNLTATAVSETRIDLSWTDNSDDEDGFEIRRSTGGAFTRVAAVGADTTAWSDTTLAPCTGASYVVVATGSAGSSDASNIASAATSGDPPAPPSGLAATVTELPAVELSWTLASPAPDSVTVERAAGGGIFGTLAVLGGTAAWYRDTAVEAGGSYRYRVRAGNGCGASDPSDEVGATIPDGGEPISVDFSWTPQQPFPGEPVRFTVSVSGPAETLSWDFGDGTTSSGGDTAHTFPREGVYTVRLTAAGEGASAVAEHTVAVQSPPPLVAASARTPGVNGTSWRTDLAVLGVGAAASWGRIVLHGADGGTLGELPYSVAPGELRVLEDVVGQMDVEGTGSLEVVPESGTVPHVMSRTYTGESGGTYGQAIPTQALIHAGHLVITGLRGAPGFRTNFGLASASASAVTVTPVLHVNGRSIHGPVLALRPYQQSQWPVDAIFGSGVLDGEDAATLELEVTGPVAAYASVVDELSGDPVFLPAVRPATDWLVPVVGRGAGAEGTMWDTDLVLANLTGERVTVALEYRGGGTVGHQRTTLSFGAGETRRIASVQQTLWGIGAGLGSVAVSATGPVAVETRIATPRPGGAGSMGQRIGALTAEAAGTGLWIVPWVRHDAGFRTNIGIVNAGTAARTVSLVLHRGDGTVAGGRQVTVPAGGLVQSSLEALFGADALPAEGWVEAANRPQGVMLYASQVDNVSGDPAFVPGG